MAPTAAATAAAPATDQPTPTAPVLAPAGSFTLAVSPEAATGLNEAIAALEAAQPEFSLRTTTVADGPAALAAGTDFSLTVREPGAASSGEGSVVARLPLAIAVPLTAPENDISLAQAVGLLTGTVTNWQQVGEQPDPIRLAVFDAGAVSAVGGLAGRSDLTPIGTRVAGAGTLLSEVNSGTDEAVVVPWLAPQLHSKALRIDGALPSDPAYPLMQQELLATLNEARQPAAAQLALALSSALAAPKLGTVTLDAVGDLMLARGVAAQVQKHGVDWPFAAVTDRLHSSDVRFANLELSLTDRGTQAHKDYTFRAPPSEAQGLADAGFTVADLANNHILDYGSDGLLDTIAALNGVGVQPVGAGADPVQAHRPVIITEHGLRIAWLAYVNVPDDSITGFVARSLEAGPGRPGVAWGTPDLVRADVLAARQQADIVIVALHAGLEYTSTPNSVQRDLAHAAIDAGAALVIGAHPHVLQGIEFYHGGVIAYSLGNFVFDLDQSDRATYGLPSVWTLILRFQLSSAGVTGIEVYPAIINSIDYRPEPVSGDEARPIYQRLYSLTEALNPH